MIDQTNKWISWMLSADDVRAYYSRQKPRSCKNLLYKTEAATKRLLIIENMTQLVNLIILHSFYLFRSKARGVSWSFFWVLYWNYYLTYFLITNKCSWQLERVSFSNISYSKKYESKSCAWRTQPFESTTDNSFGTRRRF